MSAQPLTSLLAFPLARVTLDAVDVTAEDVARIPQTNLRVPWDEFVALWRAAERYSDEHPSDWYAAGVVVSCRWLARARVRPATGPWHLADSPVTERTERAYEELIEAELLAAETLAIRRPETLEHRPGWVEAVVGTLQWAWRRTAPPPLTIDQEASAAG